MPRAIIRAVNFALQIVAVTGLIATAAPVIAGQQSGAVSDGGSLIMNLTAAVERGPSVGIQLAFHEDKSTRTLPVGTIRLRVIDKVGGRALKAPINWRVLTYGRDGEGQRHLLAAVKGATPELVLPAAWYIVYAHLPDQVIRHPVEVTAGRTFRYTLVKSSSGSREQAAAQAPDLR